jgi:hypothetical protein
MGSNASEIFGDALSRGPAILFLGQEVLRFQTGIDPLLAELSREIGKKQFQDYRELIKQAVAVSTPIVLLECRAFRQVLFDPKFETRGYILLLYMLN